MKLPASTLIVLCLASTAFAGTSDDDLAKLRSALVEHDHSAAAAELRTIERTLPDIFLANDLDYLLGRTLERLGDTAGAIENFESVRRKNSSLRGYALWHLAGLARSSGNLFLERLYLTELAAFNADSLTADAARTRLAESFLNSGDYVSAIRSLESASSPRTVLPGSVPAVELDRDRKRQLLLARSYLLAGRTSDALNLFNGLIASTANAEQPDDIALAAVRGLDASDADASAASVLTGEEHYRRAAVYYFNRDFESARLHYLAVVENFGSGTLAPRSVFQIGRTFAQEGNYVEAVKWFEREQERSGDPTVARDSLLQAASAYARNGKYREAVARYQSYIENYPNDENVDRAYLNIIDVLRDQGEETAAVQQAQKVQEIFRGKPAEALAIFSEARLYIARSDWTAALDALERLSTSRADLGGSASPGGTSPAEVAFLRGYALEQLGRFAEAIDVYLSIPDSVNEYYGGLADDRLKQFSLQTPSKPAAEEKLSELIAGSKSADPLEQWRSAAGALRLATSEETRTPLFNSLAQAYSKLPASSRPVKATPAGIARRAALTGGRPHAGSDPHRDVAEKLLYLGLYDEAAPEYEAGLISASRPGTRLTANDAYTLAELYIRGDRGDRAGTFFRRLWELPTDHQPEMIDPEFARFGYPAPYKDLLLSYAAPRGVDPRFLLSIIRQESGFRPTVKSNAAARGLMQFTTTTADQTARGLGLGGFLDDDLYDPQVSILFGSRYAQQLFTLFPGMPEAVAASYNGGEDNMKRWLTRSRSRLPERYVPEIAFAQSKDYVFRVMNNYRMYQLLYDENLDIRPAAFAARAR